MADERLTMLDLIRANASDDVVGLIEEIETAAPELSVFPADTIPGTSYETLFRVELPTVGFRAGNAGTEATKSRTELRKVQTYIIDALIEADKALANSYSKGPDAYKAFEAFGVMQAALIKFGSQVYYGKPSATDLGFPGLQYQYDATMEVDATGSTVDTGSSVYGVKLGTQGVQTIFGNNMTMGLDEWGEHMATDADGKRFRAYFNTLQSWIGLQATNKNAIGCIKNLTAQAGKGLTDDLVSSLLFKFPVGSKPDVLLMNRRSLEQLQQSRTATNPTGAPAPIPDSSHNVRIVVTDSIVSTEAIR